MVVVHCEQVWQEISNYLDGEVDPVLRSALDDHLRQCQRCTAVMAGTRNIVDLYGDDRLFKVPLGYSWRLQRRIASDAPARPRRMILGWLAATAALAVVAGTIELERWRAGAGSAERSNQAHPGHGVPPDLVVYVTNHGKLFHVKGCPFMKEDDNPHELMAAEAMKEGYTPCDKCMKQYLTSVITQWVNRRMAASVVPVR